jgi:hypothetical protein
LLSQALAVRMPPALGEPGCPRTGRRFAQHAPLWAPRRLGASWAPPGPGLCGGAGALASANVVGERTPPPAPPGPGLAPARASCGLGARRTRWPQRAGYPQTHKQGLRCCPLRGKAYPGAVGHRAVPGPVSCGDEVSEAGPGRMPDGDEVPICSSDTDPCDKSVGVILW